MQDRVVRAAERAGRDPASVKVVAVTKGHPVAAIEAVLAAGLVDLGENRVEDLEKKLSVFIDHNVVWHMVGHIQGRKAGRAAQAANLIHSVDSLRLAKKLARAGVARVEPVRVLVQVNASGEATKGGFPAREAVDAIAEIAELPGLEVAGLMTMAPFVSDESTVRSTFRSTREIAEQASKTSDLSAKELSMGMSNDYEFAVAEGSTIVRLGTALLGPRPGQIQRPPAAQGG